MWTSGAENDGKPGTSAPTPPPVAKGTPGVVFGTLPPAAAPKRYRCKLSSVADVNREIQRVYRECRSGLVDVGDGSKLAHILSLIARIHETSDLEARLAALEGGR